MIRFLVLLIFSMPVVCGAQTPGNVSSNLKLWLKADAGTTGSAPISAWNDQSGNGYHVSAPGNAPDLVTGAVNFNPVLDFDRSSNEYLEITGGILGAATYNDMWFYSVSQAVDLTTTTLSLIHI